MYKKPASFQPKFRHWLHLLCRCRLSRRYLANTTPIQAMLQTRPSNLSDGKLSVHDVVVWCLLICEDALLVEVQRSNPLTRGVPGPPLWRRSLLVPASHQRKLLSRPPAFSSWLFSLVALFLITISLTHSLPEQTSSLATPTRSVPNHSPLFSRHSLHNVLALHNRHDFSFNHQAKVPF